MARNYVLDSGEIVWLQSDPQAGHEQAGHRPALLLSPAIYNGKAGLMPCCLNSGRSAGERFYPLIYSSHMEPNGFIPLPSVVSTADRNAVRRGVVPSVTQ